MAGKCDSRYENEEDGAMVKTINGGQTEILAGC